MSETSASPGVSGASSVVQDAAASHSSLPSWPLIGRNPLKPYLMFLVLKSLESTTDKVMFLQTKRTLQKSLSFCYNLVRLTTAAADAMIHLKVWRAQSGNLLSHVPNPFRCTGRGSYGSVYQARVKDSDEIVAIKVIPVGEHDDIGEIQKEIDMLKECNHPNIVHYLVRGLACLHPSFIISLLNSKAPCFAVEF